MQFFMKAKHASYPPTFCLIVPPLHENLERLLSIGQFFDFELIPHFYLYNSSKLKLVSKFTLKLLVLFLYLL